MTVSILVLLDVILKELFLWPGKKGYTSFNPCFVGCYSESFVNLGMCDFAICFNPCFVGCYSESEMWMDKNTRVGCFNPCFVGCYSESIQRLLLSPLFYQFQSLFCWMLF